MDTTAEAQEESRKFAPNSGLRMEMRTLTRDGTAETISRDQILRREREQGYINLPCSANHEQD